MAAIYHWCCAQSGTFLRKTKNTTDILNHKSYKQSTESIHCSTSNLKTEQVNIYSKSDADKNREQLNKMMY